MLGGFVRDFARYTGPRGLLLGLYLLLGAVLDGVGILLLLPLLGVLLGSGTGNGWLDGATRALLSLAPAGSRTTQLLFLLGLFAALIAFRAFVILRRDVAMAELQTGFVEAQRLRIVELLAQSRWDAVARLSHGRITHVLGEDVQGIGNAAYLLLQSSVSAALLAGQWLLIFLLSPLLALFVGVLLGAGALALRPVLRRSAELGSGLNETNLGLITGTAQFLGGLKLALSQNLQGGFLAEFRHSQERAASRRVAFIRQRTGTQLTLTALAAAIAGLVILIGVGLIGAAPSALIAFLFVLARMNGPAAQLQASAQHIFHSLPAYGSVKALQAELSVASQVLPPRSVAVPQGPIEFRGVTYRHQDDAGVAGIDLVIEPGTILGLTGPSGAGKTTFADLLVGLYAPQQGRVTVGGAPLEGPLLAAWRSAISYVSQDPFLFHDSIRGNLLWARPEADEAALWEALTLAGADGIVRRLPAGLEAVVGERGTLLSGGERQRIALARALVRRPRLLLLDEATNAIDIAGEEALLDRIRALPERPTVVMIAHRDSSLAFCDRIVSFENGRLAQSAS
ncbi:MAG: ABC transporter ATP-binding protein [Alphaproteobacteria bacterium]|nr:MAG: ABC transporter ATP-binding protein [Alphaproteobacteria bacterium]